MLILLYVVLFSCHNNHPFRETSGPSVREWRPAAGVGPGQTDPPRPGRGQSAHTHTDVQHTAPQVLPASPHSGSAHASRG